jgi:coproporphyrinogen III oxidase-like Fe-S oxidoreductase
LRAYIEKPNGVTDGVEELNARDKASEEAMLRLRLLTEGLDLAGLASKFEPENVEALSGRLNSMVLEGSLISDGLRYRLEPSRTLTSNPIFAEVVCS